MIIDEEFKNLIPPLSEEEFNTLKENIILDGCRDALVTWNDVLIDGHNRYNICTMHGIQFKTVSVFNFTERNDIKLWIINNQLGRRNLTDYARGELALQAKAAIEAKAAARRLATLKQNSDSEISHERDAGRTDEVVAAIAGVSSNTLRKIEYIQAEAMPEIRQAARVGNLSINLASKVAELEPDEQKEIALKPPDQIREYAREKISVHVANNSGMNEWYTPSKYIEAARQTMGSIDTDPASCELANKTVNAAQFFDIQNNGLLRKWSGNVWMNPPYAQPLVADFCAAITKKFEDGEISQACILVNNATETQWFQELLSCASAICFPRSRIRFIDINGNPTGSPLQGQAIIYFGENYELFEKIFKPEGYVFIGASND